MSFQTSVVQVLLFVSLSAASATAGGPMSLLGAPAADPASQPVPEAACRPAVMTGGLKFGALSGSSVQDVADRARALGVNLEIEKLGGLIVKTYHFEAKGCADALKKLWAYLDRLSGR